MSEKKAEREIISTRKTRAGVLEQVSENVFLMDIDLSEPTGEDYFKTSEKYDNLNFEQPKDLATESK